MLNVVDTMTASLLSVYVDGWMVDGNHMVTDGNVSVSAESV